jgi:hypothetical protein
MLFFFDCPKCLKVVKADSSLGGDMAVCPHCEAQLLVPMDAVGPGTLVGGFHLVRKLGVGGMGDVYLAEQPSLKRLVALKVLPPAMTRKERFLDRFVREVRMHGSLQHPNIATAYDAGVDRGIYFLAMEYADGVDLNQVLEREGRLPEAEALHIAREVAFALKHAWERKRIIHCDIKPGNLIRTSDGGLKVLDLGLSKSLVDVADLTQTGYMVGTPLYMSPEQADGSREMDFRTDLYSLGSTLYHLVTGRPPYTGKTVSEVIAKRATTDPRPAREWNPDLTPGCENLLRRLLQRDPARRFATYDAFLDALERVRRGRKIPASAGPPARIRLLQVGGGAALLLACAVILLAGRHASPPAPPPPPAATAGSATDLLDGFASAERLERDQPQAFDLHLQAYRALSDTARARDLPALVLRAEEQARRVRELRDRQLNALMADLRAQAQALLDRHEYVRAAEVVQEYSGPLRLESEAARQTLAVAVRAQAQTRRKEAVEALLRDLEARAESLRSAGREAEAQALLEASPAGPLELASREERRALRDRLQRAWAEARAARAQQEIQAESAWRELLQRVAVQVRRGGAVEALGLWRQARTNALYASRSARLESVERDLTTFARADFLVITAFTNDLQREVEVQLVRGPVRARVERVNPPVVEAARHTEQGSAHYKWTVADLAFTERWRRSEQHSAEVAPLLCAHTALAAGNDKAALNALGRHSGELARALVALLDPTAPP